MIQSVSTQAYWLPIAIGQATFRNKMYVSPSKNILTLNILTLTILEYHNFNYLFSKIFEICFNPYKRIKLFQKSTKCPRSLFSGALYTEVDFTHLRESSEMTM